MADIDTIRNDDGACVDDVQKILQSIADHALECKAELALDVLASKAVYIENMEPHTMPFNWAKDATDIDKTQ